MSARRLASWADRRVWGLRALDVMAAGVLSALAVVMTSGLGHTGSPHGGLVPAIAALTMTLPVAWRSRAPVAAAGALALGAVLNGLALPPMVRCGAALPAVFLVAFALGISADRRRAGAGMFLCAGNISAQSAYDPHLGLSTVILMVPVLAGFFAAGRLVRSRNMAAESLRARTAELRSQREETARLAVQADRARVAADLDGELYGGINAIAAAAAAGRQALEADPAAADLALASIEQDGREVLRRMREVVGALRDGRSEEPQPTLAQIADLLSRATSADTRLRVEGVARNLPAGLELAGYRIVEHLLVAVADASDAGIDVRVRFQDDAVELSVLGPPAADVDLPTVLATARQRAGLHGGTIEAAAEGHLRALRARIPLVSGYA